MRSAAETAPRLPTRAVEIRFLLGSVGASALIAVLRAGTATPVELARELSITSFRSTCLVNRLAADGHLRWGINPKDQRGLLVRLSPGTHRALEALRVERSLCGPSGSVAD